VDTVAQTLVLLWVAGWTLAMVRAGWRARAAVVPRSCTEKIPNKSTGIPG
jgi:hypothetical protein